MFVAAARYFKMVETPTVEMILPTPFTPGTANAVAQAIQKWRMPYGFFFFLPWLESAKERITSRVFY